MGAGIVLLRGLPGLPCPTGSWQGGEQAGQIPTLSSPSQRQVAAGGLSPAPKCPVCVPAEKHSPVWPRHWAWLNFLLAPAQVVFHTLLEELNTALLLSSPWRRGLNWEHLESRSPSTMMDVSAVLGKLVEVVGKGSFLPPRKDPGKLSQLPGLLFEISAAPVRHVFHCWASAASSVCCEDERASSSLFPDLHCVSV